MNYIDKDYLTNNYPELDISSYSVTTISGVISQASGRVDNYLGYSAYAQDITEKLEGVIDSDDNLVIFTRKKPINSLSSVKIVKGDYDLELPLTDYDIPSTKERIVIPTRYISLQTVSIMDFRVLKTTKFFVEISYNAGYIDIPEVIKEATAMYCLDKFSKRTNMSGATSVSQGGISVTYSSKRGKSEFVLDAEELLNDYRSVI